MDLTILFDNLVPLVFAVLSPVAIWLSGKVADMLKVEKDSKVRDYLSEALDMGIAYAERRVSAYNTKVTDIDFGNEVVRDVVEYVTRAVPDALTHFNITPGRLEDMVEARLGVRRQLADAIQEAVDEVFDNDGRAQNATAQST